jgi:hypothetical protein
LIEAVLRKNAYVAVVYCLFVQKRSSAFDGCSREYEKESIESSSFILLNEGASIIEL